MLRLFLISCLLATTVHCGSGIETPRGVDHPSNALFKSLALEEISIDELQEKVWSYQSDMETHTVETHVYRLRKKILGKFSDNQFIISKKDGYQIK